MLVQWSSAAIYAALILGLRHASESHNLAAIGDFSTTTGSAARSLALVALYTLGHILAIAAIGVLSVGVGLTVPPSADFILERFVGLTLIIFGTYVLFVLFATPGALARHSRVTLMIAGARWMAARVGLTGDSHDHHSALSNPAARAAAGPAFMLGLVHGISLETPTQLSLFVLAAGQGGWLRGLLCVGAFVSGLAGMTLVMAAFAAGLYSFAGAIRWIQSAIVLAAGVYSVAFGFALLLGFAT